MPTAARRPPLVVIAFDGLSLEQAQVLASRLRCFDAFPGTFSRLTGFQSSTQSIWSELLTGKRWFEVGCPGYARPRSSLADLQIVDEADLLAPTKLLGGEGAVAINVPLLRPQSGRIWLSDGSLPMQAMIVPEILAQQAPFSDYVARPFASTNIALSDVGESVVNCLKVESNRLNCFESLLDRDTWSRCILRISAFDLLSHLVGNDFLTAPNLMVSTYIDRFIDGLDRVLQKIEQKGFGICFLSGYSHVDCYARVNLNRVLELSGFCQIDYARANVADERAKRRALAANLVNAANDPASEDKHATVSSTTQVNVRGSVAMSPVQGAIYLNGKDRFVDGVVDAANHSQVRRRVMDAVHHHLSSAIGSGFTIWENADEQKFAPDLMVYAPGVDFHDSAEPSVVDVVSRPRSIHCAQGFVWLPAGVEKLAQVMEPVQVSALVNEWCMTRV